MNTTHTTHQSTSTTSPSWLRPAVVIDAGVSGVNGLVYLVAASMLSDLLGPSATLIQILGVVLVGWAVALAAVATRDPLPRVVIREIGYLNLVWVAGSVAAAAGLLSLTGIGLAWCLLQAATVTVFAAAQILGTRR
ncbi:hypothetical protein [Nocardioides limicola]|uniref:hypothetical protein n=1 Tax=Nocardioides limicola TaxID=2803368 RepID=UPI00193C811B|nr:hypothetical protein [Nocardioides sp. DJM-14]